MKINYLMPQQRNISKGSKVWYGGISENGVVRWVSLKTENRSIALDWFAKMQASRFSPQVESQKRLILRDAIEAFISDREKIRRRATGTLRGYRCILRSLHRYCESNGIGQIEQMNALLCSEFASKELANVRASTAKMRVVIFRSFFNWVSDHYGVNMSNPFSKIVTPGEKPKPRLFWTVEECERIIAATNNNELKCFFALMAYAGLRKEEARHLRIEDIKDGKISLVGKGGKFAKIPISKRLAEYLNRYLTLSELKSGPLFPGLASYSRISEDLVHVAAEKAGVSNADTAHYHRFRHSFASNLLRAGKSIKAVQMLMRHENVTLTLNIYGHLLPSDLEEAAEL